MRLEWLECGVPPLPLTIGAILMVTLPTALTATTALPTENARPAGAVLAPGGLGIDRL